MPQTVHVDGDNNVRVVESGPIGPPGFSAGALLAGNNVFTGEQTLKHDLPIYDLAAITDGARFTTLSSVKDHADRPVMSLLAARINGTDFGGPTDFILIGVAYHEFTPPAVSDGDPPLPPVPTGRLVFAQINRVGLDAYTTKTVLMADNKIISSFEPVSLVSPEVDAEYITMENFGVLIGLPNLKTQMLRIEGMADRDRQVSGVSTDTAFPIDDLLSGPIVSQPAMDDGFVPEPGQFVLVLGVAYNKQGHYEVGEDTWVRSNSNAVFDPPGNSYLFHVNNPIPALDDSDEPIVYVDPVSFDVIPIMTSGPGDGRMFKWQTSYPTYDPQRGRYSGGDYMDPERRPSAYGRWLEYPSPVAVYPTVPPVPDVG